MACKMGRTEVMILDTKRNGMATSRKDNIVSDFRTVVCKLSPTQLTKTAIRLTLFINPPRIGATTKAGKMPPGHMEEIAGVMNHFGKVAEETPLQRSQGWLMAAPIIMISITTNPTHSWN